MKKCCKNTALLFAVTLACAAAPALAVSAHPQNTQAALAAKNNQLTVQFFDLENDWVFFQDARGKNHKISSDDFAKAYYKLGPSEKNTRIAIRGYDAKGRLHTIKGRLLDVRKERKAVELLVAQAPSAGEKGNQIILKNAEVTLSPAALAAESALPECYTTVMPRKQTRQPESSWASSLACEVAQLPTEQPTETTRPTMAQPHSGASNRLSLRRREAEATLREACEVADPEAMNGPG
jgi:hypothetical protein